MTGKYCVVIPALNESKTIGDLIRRIRPLGLAIVVIDDGSRDRTAAVASDEGALVISHLRNQGKGSALRTGFEHALRAQFDGVVTLDGDGQHDPAEIPQLIEAGERQHAGIVVGNRMPNGSVMPPQRRMTNRVMSAIVSRLVRQAIPDSQCGFRFIRKEVLATVPLRAKRYEIETELLLAACRRRWKIVSVPVKGIYAAAQISRIRPVRETFRFLGVVGRYLLRWI
jgi:glycosyltransferase involved in cell wall biosynthesis